MKKGKLPSLSTLDTEVLNYVLLHKRVSMGEVKRVFNLTKQQGVFVVHKLKTLAQDKITFSREGRHTFLWETAEFEAVAHEQHTLPIAVEESSTVMVGSPWPMNSRDAARCALNKKLQGLWSVRHGI